VIWYPALESDINTIKKLFFKDGDVHYKLSKSFGALQQGYIISIKFKEILQAFKFVESFDMFIWIAFILSICLISLFVTIQQNSIKNYFLYFWQYSALLLSEPITTFVYKRDLHFRSNKIILSFWLLSCTVLLSAFAGVIRVFFIKSIPNNNIDSWEQLYDRKEMRIITLDISFFNNYIQEFKNLDIVAQEFYNRMEEPVSIIDSSVNKLMFNIQFIDIFIRELEKILTGKYVIVLESYFFEQMINENLGNGDEREKRIINDIKKLHISENGGGVMPYFIMIINNNKTKGIEHDINNL
jgi:hypothetical protein